MLLSQLTSAIPPSGGRDPIACLQASRPIPAGDSTLIVVGTVGTSMGDTFSGASSSCVWVRGERVWMGRDPNGVHSDVYPLTDESKC